MQDRNDNFFWRQARGLAAAGRGPEAEKHYREAQRFNPFDTRVPAIAQELADLLGNLGKAEEAALVRAKASQLLQVFARHDGPRYKENTGDSQAVGS